MRPIFLPIAAIVLAAPIAAQAQTAAFDGTWNVKLSCPRAQDGAKGYSRVFVAAVKNGHLLSVSGKEGEPGWQTLHGQIRPDGSASLILDGIVKNADYAVGDSPRGKPFTYEVQATFDGSSGTGRRMSGRVCTFRFTR
jgi:hypothetical protein